MNKYKISQTTQFKKDLKQAIKRGYDITLISNVVDTLIRDEKLATKYKDHALAGNYKGCRECHIAPDWLLVYELDRDTLILYLMRTGSHSDLF